MKRVSYTTIMKLVKIIIDEYKEGNLINYDRSVIDFDKKMNYFMGSNNYDKLHLFQLIKDILTGQAIQQRCDIKIYCRPDEDDYGILQDNLCDCVPVKWLSKKIRDYQYNESLVGINYKYPNRSHDLLYNYYSFRKETGIVQNKKVISELMFDVQTVKYNDGFYSLKSFRSPELNKYKFLLFKGDYRNEKRNLVSVMTSIYGDMFQSKIKEYLGGDEFVIRLKVLDNFNSNMAELKDIVIKDMAHRGDVYTDFYKKYASKSIFDLDDIHLLVQKSLEVKKIFLDNRNRISLANSGVYFLYQINNLIEAVYNNVDLILEKFGIETKFENWSYSYMIIVVLVAYLFDESQSLFIIEPNDITIPDLQIMSRIRNEIIATTEKQINLISHNNKVNDDAVKGKNCIYVFKYQDVISVSNIDYSINKILSSWDIAEIIENFNREHLICEGYSEYEYFSMCKFDFGYDRIKGYSLINANGSSNSLKLLRIFSNVLKDSIVGKTKIIILLDYDGVETIKQIFSPVNKDLFNDTRNINVYMWFKDDYRSKPKRSHKNKNRGASVLDSENDGNIVLERVDTIAKKILKINNINLNSTKKVQLYDKLAEMKGNIRNYGKTVELEDVFDCDPDIKKLNKLTFEKEIPDRQYYKLNQRMKNNYYKTELRKLGEKRIPKKFFELIDKTLSLN